MEVPVRFVAYDIGTRFHPCDTHETFNPAPSRLSYVKPASHHELLQSIAAREIYVLQQTQASLLCRLESMEVCIAVDWIMTTQW